jgi:hypothetical protein
VTLSNFRYDAFSVFEWCIVVLCFFVVCLQYSASIAIPLDPQTLRFLRLIRVLRLLRAAKVFKAMRSVESLSDAIKRAAPSLVHMVMILAVFYFCFGIMGVAFFGLMYDAPKVSRSQLVSTLTI